MSSSAIVVNPAGCACSANSASPLNLPGLDQIVFRAGDFNSFRTALLTPLLSPAGADTVEQSLTEWSSGIGVSNGANASVADLAVMMVEWWAYLGDILTLYNERIANEDYLRTCIQPESAAGLVRLLGYRPRPAIAATGTLAALVTPSIVSAAQPVTLPKGLQFQSKPGPGQAPQTFELFAATPIGIPDMVPAAPKTTLIGPASTFLMQGAVTSVGSGTPLLLGPRDSGATPSLIVLSKSPIVQTVAGGGKQTTLTFGQPVPVLDASDAKVTKANQTASLWTVNTGTFGPIAFEEVSGGPFGEVIVIPEYPSGNVVHLASLARQIHAGDWLVFSAPNTAGSPQLVQVVSAIDVLGDAGASGTAYSVSNGIAPNAAAIPVLHTQLTLSANLSAGLQAAYASVTVLFDWIEFGTLLDQPAPPWDGAAELEAIQPAAFAATASAPVLLADSAGNGAGGPTTLGTLAADGGMTIAWPSTTALPLSPPMTSPIDVLYNLLAVTCGKTVSNEVLGSGDATVSGQSFTLSKSPVTYLASGSSYASTIAITVNGQPWQEVSSFYGQPANAQVFVTREDAQQQTHIDFGDGVNGACLPTGTNNVIATYRVGGGSASPPAGKLTVISQAYPGLRSLLNPVAVSGGSDPDPASLLKQYAPRSVLTFGRAVSIDDYQAIAAQCSGVTLASAQWSWDQAAQHAAVTVYVAGEPNVAVSVNTALSAAGDPNRPIGVKPATAIDVVLNLALIVTPGMDTGAITAGVISALTDPLVGLFSPANMGIGQPVFNSQIEAACLGVSGVVALSSSIFTANSNVEYQALHVPGEGAYYLLTADNVIPSTENDPNA